MSQAFLKDLLEREIAIYAEKYAGNLYRSEAEHKTHTFIVKKKAIHEQIVKDLEAKGVYEKLRNNRTTMIGGRYVPQKDKQGNQLEPVKKGGKAITDTIKYLDEQIIGPTVDRIMFEVKSAFRDLIVDVNSEDLELVITETRARLTGAYVYKGKGQYEYDKFAESIYSNISNSFKASRTSLKSRINTLLRSIGEEELGEKNIIVLGHMGGSSIIESRTSASIQKLKSTIESKRFRKEGQVTWEEFLSLFTTDDVLLLSKLDGRDLTNFFIAIESASLNDPSKKVILEKLGITEKTLRQAYIDALTKATEKVKSKFPDRPGSDSRLTIEKKKQVANFVKNIKKNKRIKVTSIDTKLLLSNAAPVKTKLKKKKPKRVKTKKLVKTPKVSSGVNVPKDKKVKKQVTQPTFNLNALKAQINARLSMTVIKNMGTPALENRTGRFARSVQVTDVTQTSKGFPSIGYTYQKYPYQTFEPGFKQGSVQRDPRTLIDRSIREIASELLVGRFYTRRV